MKLNEHKSKCGICRDLIPLVKDDVASEGSREYVHEHIKECRECFDEYESYSALSADREGEAKYNKLAERIKTILTQSEAAAASCVPSSSEKM